MPCLDASERFIHAETPDYSPLIKAGLLHVQFESIHPFLDGNGRFGRLLITLYLCSQKVLVQPLLYLSLYFKMHRTDGLLPPAPGSPRTEGVGSVAGVFLEGVETTASQAFDTGNRIVQLFKIDRERIGAAGDRASSALQIHEFLQASPFITAPKARERTGLTMPTINNAIGELQRLGIVQEVTGRKRGRVYRSGIHRHLKRGLSPDP
jgi:Fic family protein